MTVQTFIQLIHLRNGTRLYHQHDYAKAKNNSVPSTQAIIKPANLLTLQLLRTLHTPLLPCQHVQINQDNS